MDKIGWFIFEKFGATAIGAFLVYSVYWVYKHLTINWLNVVAVGVALVAFYVIGMVVIICILGLLDKVNGTDSLNGYIEFLTGHRWDEDDEE